MLRSRAPLADAEAKCPDRQIAAVESGASNRTDPFFCNLIGAYTGLFFCRSRIVRSYEGLAARRRDAECVLFAPDPLVGEGESAERAQMALRIVNAPRDYSYAFLEKDWVLYESDPNRPYLIGDHPLVMHNDRSAGSRGNVGLTVEGIRFLFRSLRYDLKDRSPSTDTSSRIFPSYRIIPLAQLKRTQLHFDGEVILFKEEI